MNISEGYTKAMKVFINMAKRYGAKIVSDKGKHLKFRDSLGHQISAPKTTSDWRAIKNFESELKGRGFINQQATKKVKDALVKGTKTTALPASRKTANQQTTFKQFTQRFQPNVQGPRKPNVTKAEISKRELENRMEKGYKQSIKDMPADVKYDLANKVLRDLRKSKVTEQMVVPRSIKKKNPLMNVKTEMEILKQLSNRPGIYHRLRTGKPMPPFSEENKHRDAKLLGQYRMLQDVQPPKKPLDVLKQQKGLV